MRAKTGPRAEVRPRAGDGFSMHSPFAPDALAEFLPQLSGYPVRASGAGRRNNRLFRLYAEGFYLRVFHKSFNVAGDRPRDAVKAFALLAGRRFRKKNATPSRRARALAGFHTRRRAGVPRHAFGYRRYDARLRGRSYLSPHPPCSAGSPDPALFCSPPAGDPELQREGDAFRYSLVRQGGINRYETPSYNV